MAENHGHVRYHKAILAPFVRDLGGPNSITAWDGREIGKNLEAEGFRCGWTTNHPENMVPSVVPSYQTSL